MNHRVRIARQNFIEFLRHPDSIINHEFLWEFVTNPEMGLFNLAPSGLNLIIIKLDNTSNPTIVCPPVAQMDPRNKTVVLIQTKSTYYEPIFTVRESYIDPSIDGFKPNKKSVQQIYERTRTCFFVSQDADIAQFDKKMSHPKLKRFIQFATKNFNTRCRPIQSHPESSMKMNHTLDDIIRTFDAYKIEYTHVVDCINYDGKVVGMIVRIPGIMNKPNELVTGFIPCHPSPNIIDLARPETMIDSESIHWMSYTSTVQFLRKIHELTKGNIPVLPVQRVVDGSMTVGVVTETNQYVRVVSEQYVEGDADVPTNRPTNVPTNRPTNELPVLLSKDFIDVDVEIITSDITNVDETRIKHIKSIQLENYFYTTFRTAVRSAIVNPVNDKYRKKLIELVRSEDRESFKGRIMLIYGMLTQIAEKSIQFVDNTVPPSISSLNKLELDVKIHSSVFPKNNLMMNGSNDMLYYIRMADELARYSRIQNFVLEPNKYLAFSGTTYNLTDNELLITQTILLNGYYQMLQGDSDRNYDTFRTHRPTRDNAVPMLTRGSENILHNSNIYPEEKLGTADNTTIYKTNGPEVFFLSNTSKQLIPKPVDPDMGNEPFCDETYNKLSSKDWMSRFKYEFPGNTTEIIFQDGKPSCSFRSIQMILQRRFPDTTDGFPHRIVDIKERLVNAYTDFVASKDGNEGRIIVKNFMSKYGDNKLAIFGGLFRDLSNPTFDIKDYIVTDSYPMTLFDMWLLARLYKIPVIIYSSGSLPGLPEGEKGINYMRLTSDGTNKYFFIKIPSWKNTPAVDIRYRLLALNPSTKGNTVRLVDILRPLSDKNREQLDKRMSFTDFVDTFANM